MAEWRHAAVRAVESELEHARQTGEWRGLGRLRQDWQDRCVDLRGRRVDPIVEVWLAGPDGPRGGASVPVRAELAGGVLRIHEPGPVPPGCDHVWLRGLTPRERLERLAASIRDLGDAPLADRLAARELDPATDTAYAACFEPGVRLVCGPPGTGKSRIVAEAAADLVRAGKRVLVVAGARTDAGWTDDSPERQEIQRELCQLGDVERAAVELTGALAGYDHAAFLAAGRRIDNTDRSDALAAEFADTRRQHDDASTELAEAQARLRSARTAWNDAGPARSHLIDAAALTERLADCEWRADTLTERLAQGRYRGRRADRKALRATESERATLEAAAEEHREAASPLTEDALGELERALVAAHEALDTAALAEADAHTRLDRLRGKIARVRSAGLATDQDRRFHVECLRRGLPDLYAQRERLHAEDPDRAALRGRLTERLWWLGERTRRRRGDAEAATRDSARLVTTTLDHLTTGTRSFDVVLVDDAGGARLADVLHAVAKARETAVVFGDPRRPGPRVRPASLKSIPDVRDWLLATPFGHCGIAGTADAEQHPGCVLLTDQYRFGPTVTALARSTGHPALADVGKPTTEVVLLDTAGSAPDRASLARFAAGTAGLAVVAPHQAGAAEWCEALREWPGGFGIAVGTARTLPGDEFAAVLVDLTGDDWSRRVRSFATAVTRARATLYLLADLDAVKDAPIGGPLGAVNALRLQGSIVVRRVDSTPVPAQRRPRSAIDRPVPVTSDGTIGG